MAKEKEHINLVFIGHVDHGKSTTVGRLMFDAGAIEEQQMRKLKERAAEVGKSGFEFAFVMDHLKEEQERGVTIDLAHKKFETDKYYFTVIDAPGHRDFVKNMITGASQADAAVLVVAANDSVQEQTKEHVWLSKTMGVNQMIVAVNKMDMVEYSQSRYEEVVKDVKDLLAKAGYKVDDVKFLPIASYPGDNSVKKSEKMPWWTGGTLLENINQLNPPEKPTTLPLRLPLQDVYQISGIGTVPVGKVLTGVMKVADKVIVVPARDGKGVTGEVKSIEMHHEQLKAAEPGDNIGFVIRGVEKKAIARGDVLGHTDNIPTVCTEFTAQVAIMNHPTVVTVGYTPVFHTHTAQIACRVTEIVHTLNPASGEKLKENPDFIKNGDIAIMKFKPTQLMCLEPQKEIPQMSRFAIRDSGKTVAVGICTEVVKKQI